MTESISVIADLLTVSVGWRKAAEPDYNICVWNRYRVVLLLIVILQLKVIFYSHIYSHLMVSGDTLLIGDRYIKR